jgi:hypothetical protein
MFVSSHVFKHNLTMGDDSSRRRQIDRLAERAKQLDDMIQKAAAMQKKIVKEIQRIGTGDRVVNRAPTKTPNGRRKR